QSGGLRPFGVSLIFAGVDEDGPKLFETDPTGIFFQFRATVIGEGEEEIEDILEKEYSEKLTIEEGLKICVKALKSFLGKNFDIERLDAAYINKTDKKFVEVKKEHLEKLLKKK
ncbi:proteasome subunit alpha, partial [Candidatus Woesearchaeota archaeon]